MVKDDIATFDAIKPSFSSHSICNVAKNFGTCVVCSLILSNAINYGTINNNLISPNTYENNIQDNTHILYWDESFIINTNLLAKKEENMNAINEIASLEYNWNDNGANKFSKELINHAKILISNFSIQPDVFPTARNSIQMEYEKTNGDYIEFELFEKGKLKVFTFLNGKFNTEYIDCNSANEVFRSFYGQQI